MSKRGVGVVRDEDLKMEDVKASEKNCIWQHGHDFPVNRENHL
jgi:hypothetical protein